MHIIAAAVLSDPGDMAGFLREKAAALCQKGKQSFHKAKYVIFSGPFDVVSQKAFFHLLTVACFDSLKP